MLWGFLSDVEGWIVLSWLDFLLLEMFLFHYPRRVVCAFSSNRMSFIVVVPFAILRAFERKRHSCAGSGGISDFGVLQIC
jgi:hypothetical protein